MYRAYICEGCSRPQRILANIWTCPGCKKEICDSCGWMYGVCKPCCAGKTEAEVCQMGNDAFGLDFIPDNPDRLAVTAERHA